jgi:hypothetical protein
MKAKRIILGATLTIVVANAAFAESVTTVYDKRANFAGYKTFMWIKEPTATDARMRERVVRDVNAALAAGGLQLVTRGADLGIAAHAATEQERTLAAFYGGFDGSWRWDSPVGSAATARGTYEIGTLVIDIFDANTKEAVWRGTSSKMSSGNPQKQAADLNKAVAKMFRNFPPTRKAKAGVMARMVEFLARGVIEAGGR